MTYRPTTSAETAQSFRDRFVARMQRSRRGEPTTRPERDEERADFRDRVFACLGRLVVKSTNAIKQELTADFGVGVDYRRVKRALDDLAAAGRSLRVGGGWRRARSRE